MKKLLGLIGSLTDDEIRSFIIDVLSPIGYNMITTSKEIDFLIEKLSKLISTSIDHSLHNIKNT